MKGIKYILSYIFKQPVLVFIALIFIVYSTYLQVEVPKDMGNSITDLTNYGTVNKLEKEQTFVLDSLKSQNEDFSVKEYLKSKPEEQVNGEVVMLLGQYQSKKAMEENPEKNTSAPTAEDLKKAEEQKIKMEEMISSGVLFKNPSGQDMTVTQFLELDLDKSKTDFRHSVLRFLLDVILVALATFVFNFMTAFVAARSTSLMKIDLFKKLQRLAIKFFDKSNDGDVLSIFTNDIDNISNMINQALVQLLSSAFLLIAITVTMLQEQVKLGLVVLTVAVVLIISLIGIFIRAKKYVSQQQYALGELNGYIDENISGQKVIITNGLEEKTKANFKPFNDKYRNTSIKGQRYSGLLFPIIQGFMLIAVALIILVGSRLAVDGIIAIGVLVTFIQYTQNFFRPFMQMSSQYSMIQLAISGANRVSAVLEEVEDIKDEGGVEFTGIKESLKLENLNFAYDEDKEGDNRVLKNINIEIYKGKMVALVGPTGSGKTTIMNLLNRFYDVHDGKIMFDNHEIKELDIKSLRRNVGIVLQDSVLFKGTVFDNISFGKDKATFEEVEAAAVQANANQFILGLENGYDTVIGDGGVSLSTGQEQLISIARTILTNPDLLILDEATSNVDTVTEAKIQRAMENVVAGRTSFVIAHRLKTILKADLILVLKEGEIIEKGNHRELMAQNGLYAELYNNQFVVS